MTAVVIRPGGPADVPATLAMLDEAVRWLVARGSTSQWGDQPWSDRPASVRLITRLLTDHQVWVAEAGDGVPLGVTVLGPAPEHVPAVGEPETYVKLLVTSRAHTGCGIGTALLDHARTLAIASGSTLLRVDCYAGPDGRLVRYYESAGFTAADEFDLAGWPARVLRMRLA